MTGRNQSTVHRAMHTGRLSFTVNEAGERRIDVAELARVFGIKATTVGANGASDATVAHTLASNVTHAEAIAVLERLLAERSASIARQDETIRDLRIRLDTETEERRRLSARLTGLLTTRASEEQVRPLSADPASPSLSHGTTNLSSAGYRARWWRWWLR